MTQARCKPERVPTAYRILGVHPGDSFEAIHEAYKSLAVTGHPDKGGDGEIFARITMAWSVIKLDRESYDRRLRFEGRLNCDVCQGRGLRTTYAGRKRREITCEVCKGTGEE